MPDQLEFISASQRVPKSLSGIDGPCASLPSSKALKTAQADSIASELIRMAECCAWERLEEFLGHLEQLNEIRGAVLMRALNVAPPSRAQTFLAYLINYGAPDELINRAITLGALPSGDVSVREVSSAAPVTVTNLHFAVLKGRFDVAHLLIREGHRAAALNAKGETASEQYARVAPKSKLRSEAAAIKIGSLVRKALWEEIAPEHLTRLIERLCKRRAWAAAEVILDECTLGPKRAREIRIPRFAISEIAWKAAVRRAPPSFFETLRTLHHSDQVAGNLTAPSTISPNFLLEPIGPLSADQLIGPVTWNALARRLAVLETAAEFTPSSPLKK